MGIFAAQKSRHFSVISMARRLLRSREISAGRFMTLKIMKSSRGSKTTIRLYGEVKAEHIDLLTAEMKDRQSRLVLDLSEVSLVDVDTIRFLDSCEAEGVELLHCSRYVREWITREQAP
jgi:hypothetical protein